MKGTLKAWAASPWRRRPDAGGEATTSDDADLIRRSGLFDASFYLGQLQAHRTPVVDPAMHYLTTGWTRPLDPGPLFKTTSYLDRYPDVAAAGVNPLLHYLKCGITEGRSAWTEADLLEWQQPLLYSAERSLGELGHDDEGWPSLRRGDVVHVHAHSRGHFVFSDFQHLIVQGLRSIGVDAQPGDERIAGKPALRIIIAPHEFFYLEGAPEGDAFDGGDCVFLNSEQMQSVWFAKAFRFLSGARWVLDINLQTAASLKRLGIAARFLPLGRLEGYPIFVPQAGFPSELQDCDLPDAPDGPETPLHRRGFDLVWIGTSAKRRQAFHDANAGLFSRFNSFVRLVDIRGTLQSGHPEAISAVGCAALAQSTKIMLNVHHFASPYFEWQRLMHFGLFQGACVVTETVSRVPHLRPGEHYLEADLEDIPGLVEWLLNDPDGRTRAQSVSRAGYQAALENFDLGRTLQEVFSVGEKTDPPAPPGFRLARLLRGRT